MTKFFQQELIRLLTYCQPEPVEGGIQKNILRHIPRIQAFMLHAADIKPGTTNAYH